MRHQTTSPHAGPATIERPRHRRGNTLVLVTAILVLLVIIATAFISRVQDGRKLATVQGHAFQREESSSIYADQLAGEITRALFPAAVDPSAQAKAWGFTNEDTAAYDWMIDLQQQVLDSGQNGSGELSLAELLAEQTLTGVARASDTEPWLLAPPGSEGDAFNPDNPLNYLDSSINIDRFGADMGDFFTQRLERISGPDDYPVYAYELLSGEPDGVRDFNDEFLQKNGNGEVIGSVRLDVSSPFFDFNFAPYETRAWTNWPDDTQDQLFVPHGPGASLFGPNAERLRDDSLSRLPLGTGNPRGNPGFGDTRWLRDSEPRRLGAYYDGDSGSLFENDDPFSERFSHWTHLSWIPTAQNGWRVCYDISNVAKLNPEAYQGPDLDEPANYATGPEAGYTLATSAGSLPVGDGERPYHDAGYPVALQTPYEQWYPNVLPQMPAIDPQTDFYDVLDDPEAFVDEFTLKRDNWFSSPENHFNVAMRDPALVLPNYYDLNRLGLESDRYVNDSPRNIVERTFADTDGDGFTDSLWFLSPHSPSPGVRQVVGVSVVDNGGMLNANVATVFDRWSTSGLTPADTALVSRISDVQDPTEVDFSDTPVGLLQDPKNQVDDTLFYPAAGGHAVKQVFDLQGGDSGLGRWFATPGNPGASRSFLNERGLDLLVNNTDGTPGPFFGQYRSVSGDPIDAGVRERALWNTLVQSDFRAKWVNVNDAGDEQLLPFTGKQFGFEDELELRSFAGLNHPARFSRLEGAVGDHVTDGGTSFSILRGDLNRPETGPLRDFFGDVTQSGKTVNEQQVRDIRHRMTLFSGARNEFRPLWLWKTRLFDRGIDYDDDRNLYHGGGDWGQSDYGDRNDYDLYQQLQRKLDLRYTPEDLTDPNGAVGGTLWASNRDYWLNDLQELIAVASSGRFYDKFNKRSAYQSYFSDPTWDLDNSNWNNERFESYAKTQKMAASLAANIDAYRDGPIPYFRENLSNFLVTRNNNSKPIYLDPPLYPLDARMVPTEDQYDLGLGYPLGDLDASGPVNGLDIEPDNFGGTVVDLSPDNPRDDGFIGLEKQPFIMQAFYGLVYPKTQVKAQSLPFTGQQLWEEDDAIPGSFTVEFLGQTITYTFEGTGSEAQNLGGRDDLEGEHFVDSDSKPAVLLAIQLGNPFDEPISLYDYSIQIGNRTIPLNKLACRHPDAIQSGTPDLVPQGLFNPDGSDPYYGYYHEDLYLGPTLPDQPRTAVIFALVPPANLGYTNFQGTPNVPQQSGFGVPYTEFRESCLDFLDLQAGDLYGYEEVIGGSPQQNWTLDNHQSLVMDASRWISRTGLSETGREQLFGYEAGASSQDYNPMIQLIRTPIDEQSAFGGVARQPLPIVVDRLQHQPSNPGDLTRSFECASLMEEFFKPVTDNGLAPPEAGNEFVEALNAGGIQDIQNLPTGLSWSGIRLGKNEDCYMPWVSFSRFWGWDVDGSGVYDLDELSPRFAYSVLSEPRAGSKDSRELYGTSGPDESFAEMTGRRPQAAVFALTDYDRNAGNYSAAGNDTWIRPKAHAAPLTCWQDAQNNAGFSYDYEPGTNFWARAAGNAAEAAAGGVPLRPNPWLISGKPFNFPTWTIVPQVPAPGVVSTQLALYDLGFPFLIHPDDASGESLKERVQPPEGGFLQTDTNEHIPMDLVAREQEEFYADYREDLWSRPMQMLLKDDDFDQIGELNQVFLWGPVIEMSHSSTTPGASYDLRPGFQQLPNFGVPLVTRRTFPELMTQVVEYTRPRYVSGDGSIDREINMPEWWNMTYTPAGSAVSVPLPADAYPAGVGVFANRLDFSSGRQDLITQRPGPGGGGLVNGLVDPGRPWRQVLGAGLQVPTYQPLLPAGAGIFDGVTIDGRGVRAGNADFDGDGTVSDYELIRSEQENANLARGYTGEPTRGLINVNTASPEVLRTLPQMSRLIYNDYFARNPFSFNQINRTASAVPQNQNNMMHVRLAEAIERYRMGDATARSTNDQADGGLYNDWVPSYADRGYTGQDNGVFDDYPSITDPFQNGSPYFGTNDFYGFYPGMRTDAGIVSLGELLTLDRTQRDEIEIYRNYTSDPAAPDNAIDYLGGVTGDYTGSQPHHFAEDFRLKSASIRALGLDPYGCSTEQNSGTWFIGYGAARPDDARARYGLGYRGFRLSSGGGGEEDPFTPAGQVAVDARVSTDRNTERRSLAWLKNPTAGLSETVYTPDMVGGDAEEANLLFSGMANLLTTRSDVFTVYFTIRSFKQDPISGFWDATDKDLVIDESRYVMVLDRSTVDGPTDQPRVIAFSKVE